MEEIKIKTSDDLELAATYQAGNSDTGIILVHTMTETKSSWLQFGNRLHEHGFHTLAIDLRGHGASGGGDYLGFSDEQHQQSKLDLMATVQYLKDKDLSVGIIGASIGANLALQYATEHPVLFVIAISAGLDYRGIKPLEFMDKIQSPTMIVGSKIDDKVGPDAAKVAQELYDKSEAYEKLLKVYDTGGHGTDMVNGDLERQKFLINWIEQIL